MCHGSQFNQNKKDTLGFETMVKHIRWYLNKGIDAFTHCPCPDYFAVNFKHRWRKHFVACNLFISPKALFIFYRTLVLLVWITVRSLAAISLLHCLSLSLCLTLLHFICPSLQCRQRLVSSNYIENDVIIHCRESLWHLTKQRQSSSRGKLNHPKVRSCYRSSDRDFKGCEGKYQRH